MTIAAELGGFIPKGPYCYQLLEVVDRPEQFPILRTRACSHIQTVGESKRCNLLGVEGDILLDDSCKICGINDDDKD